jgi:hypothetical protein
MTSSVIQTRSRVLAMIGIVSPLRQALEMPLEAQPQLGAARLTRGDTREHDVIRGRKLLLQSEHLARDAFEPVALDGPLRGALGDREAEAWTFTTVVARDDREQAIRRALRMRKDSGELAGLRQAAFAGESLRRGHAAISEQRRS